MRKFFHPASRLFVPPILFLLMFVHACCSERDPIITTAQEDCASLTTAYRDLCRDTVAKRAIYYRRFLNRHQQYVELAALLPEGVPTKLDRTRTNATPMTARQTHLSAIKSEKIQIEKRYAESMQAPSEIFVGAQNNTKFVCKVHDTARIECTNMATILSEFSNDTANIILRDIDRLYAVIELDFGNELLIACGPGGWESMGLPSDAQADFGDFLAGGGSAAILNECSQLADSLSPGRAQSQLDAGGFSGMTGFDSLGLLGFCGLETWNSDADEFTANAMQMSQEMHEQCAATLEQTMMDTLEDASLPNKKPGDGKKIDTATEISQNDDGTETVTTVDGDGGQVSETRDSTQDHDSITVNYSDGSSGHTDFYADNSSSTRNRDADGTVTFIHIKPSNDGHSVHKVTTDADGNIIDWEEEPALTPITTSLQADFESHCSDETCSSCYDFDQFNPRLGDAASSLSEEDIWTLRNFERSASCCTDITVYSGDPRLSIPNPDGDFICTGNLDSDSMTNTCQEQCKVAYDEDCLSNCLDASDGVPGIEFTLLDHICRYATSDACFVKDGGIPLPDPPPISVPEFVAVQAADVYPLASTQYGLNYGLSGLLHHVIVPVVSDPAPEP